MSTNITFNAESRERIGKGGAREARRRGMVPAVVYGGSGKPAAVNLKRNEVIRAINTGHFKSATATLIVDGKPQMVIPQDIQFHPVTDLPMHIDLMRVSARQRIKVEVPVHFLNEETCRGIKRGGSLNVVRHAVELEVPAGHIPEYLEADLAALDIGDNVKISNIKLPEDATPTITDRDFTIATIAGRGGSSSAEADIGDDTAAADVPSEAGTGGDGGSEKDGDNG